MVVRHFIHGVMVGGLFVAILIVAFLYTLEVRDTRTVASFAVLPAEHTDPFLYTFDTPGTLNETGSMELSASRYFWLNSGARLIIENGEGSTIMGALPEHDEWRRRYRHSNPEETEQGAYPQNLFRLVTRSLWVDTVQDLDVHQVRIHPTETPTRSSFSGIFLMSRYHDGNNLYYAGIRMDGRAVIKRKYKGVYYTLAEGQAFTARAMYDRYTFPNLIPTGSWLRLRMRTINTSEGVQISISLARNRKAPFEELLSVVDSGGYGPPITTAGHVGIRTDYADVRFDTYRVSSVPADW